MAKLMVKTTENFDLLSFFQKLNKFDDPLDKPERVNEDKVEFVVSKTFSFTVEGDFNAKQTDGNVDKVTFLDDGKAVLEVSETNLSLKDLITLAKHGSELVIGAFLTEDSSIFGNKGNDLLFNFGDTKFFGGAGNDVMVDDINHINKFDGETGMDTVVYQGDKTTQLGVTASLTDASLNTEEAEGDTYRSIENLIGTEYDDKLIGDKKSNELDGQQGDDILVGGAGADRLDGDKGIDFASYATFVSTTGSGVYVSLETPADNKADALGDSYISIEGLIGTKYEDVLKGDRHNNTIFGGEGGDMIDGGRGKDILWGDTEEFIGFSGSDNFQFNGLNNGLKTIMDFDNQDVIFLSRAGFGLKASYQLIDGETFISADDPVAVGKQKTFLYDRDSHELSFDADGSGSKSAEVIAKVNFDVQEYLDIGDVYLF